MRPILQLWFFHAQDINVPVVSFSIAHISICTSYKSEKHAVQNICLQAACGSRFVDDDRGFRSHHEHSVKGFLMFLLRLFFTIEKYVNFLLIQVLLVSHITMHIDRVPLKIMDPVANCNYKEILKQHRIYKKLIAVKTPIK